MSKKTETMYKDSPKLERNEKGHMHASKKKEHKKEEHKGPEEHEKHMQELEHKHSKERMHLFHKHEEEHMALKHKMMQEQPQAEQPAEGGVGATAAPDAETAGGE